MSGIRFGVIRDNRKQLKIVEYSREMEPHWCEKGHIGYVLEGRMEITFGGDGGDKVVFNPGDGLLIPNGTRHRHMAKILSEKVIVIMAETAK